MLEKLAAEPDELVRWRVANNRNCPPELLARLATDPDMTVRRRVAETRPLPPK